MYFPTWYNELSMFLTIPFSLKTTAHSYNFVPASDEEASSENNETRVLPSPKRALFFDPSIWLTTFAALSIAITIWNLLVIRFYNQELRLSYVEASIGSPYNGLEKLIRNESSPSWPLTSIHYPDLIGATEGSYIRYTLNNGSIVRLGAERTIVIQHRVRDYGLERCAVKLQLPLFPEQREYTTGDDPHLTLWRIDSWDSKAVLTSSALPTLLPSGKELLGKIALEGKHFEPSSFFNCNAGSILTLEIALACTAGPCGMEFLLARSQHQGFWVIQSE